MARLLSALLGLIGAIPLAAAPVPDHLMQKDPPLAFPTKVGTKWVYEVGDETWVIVISKVEEKDGAKLVTTERVHEDGRREPLTVESISEEGMSIISASGLDYDKPWPFVKLPYREGWTWEVKVMWSDRIGFRGTMTAGPWEKVRVPAGEFTAARIEEDRGKDCKVSSWFVHRVGLVQRGNDWKLKSFTPGKD
jgi:hypothetical protein